MLFLDNHNYQQIQTFQPKQPIQIPPSSYQMFDQEQQKLLKRSLSKLMLDYKNNSNVYSVSAFDSNFDAELKRLVINYNFDFQAIALHLCLKFPQYSHRLKPQAASYRWYQLILEREETAINQNLQYYSKQQANIANNQSTNIIEDDKDEKKDQEIVIYSLSQKLQQFKAALEKAKELDQQQNYSLMFYKPKFIIDTEYKLQRQVVDIQSNLSALMENQLICQFGKFQPHQAAPFISFQQQLQINAAPVEPPCMKQQQYEQTGYLDDDWEEYQSD